MTCIEDFLTLFYLIDPKKLIITSDTNVRIDLISPAIPYFFFLIFVEYFVAKYRGKNVYQFADTITNFNLGLFQQLLSLLYKPLTFLPYIYIYENFRIVTVDIQSPLTFVGLMLGCDIAYYWYHRICHEWHALWAAHLVHHSGEYYNLSTALRQGAYQGLTSWIAYCPLAVLGFHPVPYMAHTQLNVLYQIGSLGYYFELIMNTPSHHRMHHRPPGNCNYAGVLIIWDRIFNTFQREEGEQIDYYGLAKPLHSFNVIYANVCHWKRIMLNMNYDSTKQCPPNKSILSCYILKILKAITTRRVRQNLFSINLNFLQYDEDNNDNNHNHSSNLLSSKWKVPLSAKRKKYIGNESNNVNNETLSYRHSLLMKCYIFIQFLLVLIIGYSVLLFHKHLESFGVTIAIIFCISTMSSMGNLLAASKYCYFLETCRILMIVLLFVLINIYFSDCKSNIHSLNIKKEKWFMHQEEEFVCQFYNTHGIYGVLLLPLYWSYMLVQ